MLRFSKSTPPIEFVIFQLNPHMMAQGLPLQELPIYIYVDNYNIWIESKKLAGSKIGRREDSRVRIDIGKLAEVVAAGRPVAKGFLYGSVPPPVDTVWEKIRKSNFEVKVRKRSQVTGKEKMVDSDLVADATERACMTPKEKRSTFVVITGDADARPAIEKALKYKWNVEA
uniref:NYN domain-containing protein n=1 Tax=Amphimedon queenslandica TaxID=400682 RepID=A0A1X7SIP7_AMPQE